jgi:hypothetical protein
MWAEPGASDDADDEVEREVEEEEEDLALREDFKGLPFERRTTGEEEVLVMADRGWRLAGDGENGTGEHVVERSGFWTGPLVGKATEDGGL